MSIWDMSNKLSDMNLVFDQSFDGVLYDISLPAVAIQVQISNDRKVLWVNVGPRCALRISGIKDIEFDGPITKNEAH